ncbi:MAG TPA: ATP-binding protein [Thermomicrobiales bacterium]|nr:ATP-binding protein [Thermomicrobiales bacterium]
MANARSTLIRARQRVQASLAPEPIAYSIDGRGFGYSAPIGFPIELGSYVSIQVPEGHRYLGQLTAKVAHESAGPQIALDGARVLDLGEGADQVTSTTFTLRLQSVRGEGTMLCRLDADEPQVTGAEDGFAEATIAPAAAEDVAAWHQRANSRSAQLDIGTLQDPYAAIRATINAGGFDRHTFLCGQSGSGKTYSLGVVLERLLLDTSLRIIILDPNSDYVGLDQCRSVAEICKAFPGLHDSEADAQTAIKTYQAAVIDSTVLRRTPYGTKADNALRIWFSDLFPSLQGKVLQLDPVDDLEEFSTLLTIEQRFGDEPYSIADVRDAAANDLSSVSRKLALRITNLGVDTWDIWAHRGETPVLTSSTELGRLLVLDIGGFGRPDEQALIAHATLATLWQRREQRQPVLLVIDEAHTVCPQNPLRPLQAAATERSIQIAGEGRKFGIYLLVSTQRPQKLHTNVLSQCDNLILMRMNSEADVADLAGTFSFVSPTLLNAATGFVQGESLIAGKLTPSPTLIRFGGRYSREGGADVAADWAKPVRR